MDFSGDRVESTTRLHYWENTAPNSDLVWALFIYLFIFKCAVSSLSFTLKANLVTR